MFLKGYKFASPGSLVALVCFFLPWMMVSCNGQILAEFSGLDLATGSVLSTIAGTQKLDAQPEYWIVPAAAVLVLLLAFLAGRRGTLNFFDKVITFLLGLVPLGLMLVTVLGMVNSPELEEARQQGIALQLRWGFWGGMLGLLSIVIGSVMNWFGGKQSTTAVEAAVPVSTTS